MAKVARHVVCSTLMVLLISAMAYAQAKVPPSVYKNYEQGVSAVKAGKWQDAIAPLQAAIAADATPRSYREGVIPIDYYPQLYLFEAYVKIGDFVNANKYYNTRGPVPPSLSSSVTPFANALMTENNRVLAENKAKTDAAAKTAADAAEAKRTADAAEAKRTADAEAKRVADAAEAKRTADAAEAKRVADANRAQQQKDFNDLAGRANTAYNQKNWGSAIDLFGQAKAKSPQDFTPQFQTKLDDATRQRADADFFDNNVKNAEAAFGQKNYADAKTGYTNAKSRNPAEFANKKLQAKLDQAENELKKMGADQAKKAEIDSMVRTANNSLTNKKWDDAIAGYGSVKTKFPAEFQQQNLQAKIDEALKGKTGAANAANDAAAKAAADRAAADKAAADKAAAALVAANAKNLPAPDKLAHDGLIALLTGDAKKAAGLLEQADTSAKAKNSPAKLRSTINAYLAVAYAAQSIQSKDPSLQAKAQAQYKQAPGFTLDPRLVSPQITKIVTGTN
jgi:hypothetical protein